jgi:hypothetical protein
VKEGERVQQLERGTRVHDAPSPETEQESTGIMVDAVLRRGSLFRTVVVDTVRE